MTTAISLATLTDDQIQAHLDAQHVRAIDVFDDIAAKSDAADQASSIAAFDLFTAAAESRDALAEVLAARRATAARLGAIVDAARAHVNSTAAAARAHRQVATTRTVLETARGFRV